MRICLMGVDFTNANLGCQALGYSMLKIASDICNERGDKLIVTAIVYNAHKEAIYDKNSIEMSYICVRPKSLSFYKSYLHCLSNADMVIDFTGGDSFSDIYGAKNFIVGSLLKNIAIHSKAPLVLGPQTIGPFYRKWVKIWSSRILKKADFVFVRDEQSFQYAQQISGISAMLTTDVAFELPYTVSETNNASEKKRVGINPSGLLWFKTKTFDSKKHVTVDYREYLTGVINHLSNSEEYEIHLIPHVFTPTTTEYDEDCTEENDMQACFHIQKMFPNVIVEKELHNPMEAKSIIASMDVFTGARMHATIAAFSSGVPVIPFSYSRKFEGLYGSLDYEYLINGTSMSTGTAVAKTIEWIEQSAKLKVKLNACLPIVNKKIGDFKDKLIAILYKDVD